METNGSTFESFRAPRKSRQGGIQLKKKEKEKRKN